jgi:hypothetical protein
MTVTVPPVLQYVISFSILVATDEENTTFRILTFNDEKTKSKRN